jgi:putative oxidoreductase
MIDLYSYQNIILLLARVVLGVTFIKHGWPKIKKPFGMKDMLAELKFPIPAIFSVIVALVEFVGGIFVIAGFYTQSACLLIAVDMTVAASIKKFKTKKRWVDGYELELALLFLALLLAMFGAGDWAMTY